MANFSFFLDYFKSNFIFDFSQISPNDRSGSVGLVILWSFASSDLYNYQAYIYSQFSFKMVNLCRSWVLLTVVLFSFGLWVEGKVLSQADFVNGATNTFMYAGNHFAGLSFQLDELIPYLDSQLLQLYLLNSNLYGDWGNNFEISIRNPGGYKYNCTRLQSLFPNSTLSCKFDLSNSTFITSLGNFNWNTSVTYSFGIGWDNEAANYSDPTYMNSSFVQFVLALYRASKYQIPFLQTADKADTWNFTGFKPNYTYTDPAKDCDNMNKYLSIYYSSPGVTEKASSQWFDQISSINYYCGWFTMRGTVFPNASDLTIANLLNDNYTYGYLRKRLKINDTDYSQQLLKSRVAFNQLRLTDDPAAANTAANTFAVGLWAIDFVMEWTILGGFRVDFYNPILNYSRQGLLGQAPTFAPSALYTGLLFAIIANSNNPTIFRPALTAGTSSNIKVYGLQYYNNYGVLIINKDTSPSASGEVVINLADTSGLSCIYYSADSLNSTSGGTINGLSFIANNSNPQGIFKDAISVTTNANGLYSIPLNYSQAALCQTSTQRSYLYFPSGRSSSEGWMTLIFLAVFFLALL